MSGGQPRLQAEATIDVAILTGACMVTLVTSIGGFFSPNQQIISQLTTAGSKTGESNKKLLVYSAIW